MCLFHFSLFSLARAPTPSDIHMALCIGRTSRNKNRDNKCDWYTEKLCGSQWGQFGSWIDELKWFAYDQYTINESSAIYNSTIDRGIRYLMRWQRQHRWQPLQMDSQFDEACDEQLQNNEQRRNEKCTTSKCVCVGCCFRRGGKFQSPTFYIIIECLVSIAHFDITQTHTTIGTGSWFCYCGIIVCHLLE